MNAMIATTTRREVQPGETAQHLRGWVSSPTRGCWPSPPGTALATMFHVGPQAVDREPDAEHVDLLAAANERDEHGEDHERDDHQQPGEHDATGSRADDDDGASARRRRRRTRRAAWRGVSATTTTNTTSAANLASGATRCTIDVPSTYR